MKPTWLQRNFDLVAVALIAVFGLAGASIQRSPRVPAVIMQSDPVVHEARPKLLEIREEYEKVRTQIRTDVCESGRTLHRDLHQSAEDVRRDTQSAAFQVRNDLREAFRSIRNEMHSLRDQLRCLRD